MTTARDPARTQLIAARAELAVARAEQWALRMPPHRAPQGAERAAAEAAYAQAALDDMFIPLGDDRKRTALVAGIYADPVASQPAADAPPSKARLNQLIGHLVNAGMAPAEALTTG